VAKWEATPISANLRTAGNGNTGVIWLTGSDANDCSDSYLKTLVVLTAMTSFVALAQANQQAPEVSQRFVLVRLTIFR
jgi:hypothetical protein